MKKEYLVITIIEGEREISVMTVQELANLYQTNEDAGYIDQIIAYKLDDQNNPVKLNVYEEVYEYLNEQREIQREYEEYSEYVNEYGYDYYDEME